VIFETLFSATHGEISQPLRQEQRVMLGASQEVRRGIVIA
jgi:hypothetical protein